MRFNSKFNDTAQRIYSWIVGMLVCIIILILGVLITLRFGAPTSKVTPQPTFKQKVIDYPYRDNSATLKAAEAKVVTKMDRVIQRWNSTCRPDGKTCGAVEHKQRR